MVSSVEARQLLPLLEGMPPDVRRHVLELILDRVLEESPGVGEMLAAVIAETEGPESTNFARGIARALTTRAPMLATVDASVDVLILAIKPTERDAVLSAFEISDDKLPRVLGRSGASAWMTNVGGLSVAISVVGLAGNLTTSTFLSSIYSAMPFRSAVLVGMSAGVIGKTELGQVVVGEDIFEYEYVVMNEDGPHYEPRHHNPPDAHFRNSLNYLSFDKDIWTEVKRAASAYVPPDGKRVSRKDLQKWAPSVTLGGILAGGRLIQDGKLPKFAAEFGTRVRAAEMEGAGFAAGCKELDLPWLVVRGVADHGDIERTKEWQWPATYAAARFVRVALQHRLIFPGTLHTDGS